jgi:hypothetical protein
MEIFLTAYDNSSYNIASEWYTVDTCTEEDLTAIFSLFRSENNLNENYLVSIESSIGFYAYSDNLLPNKIVDLEELALVIKNIGNYGEAWTHFAEKTHKDNWIYFERAFYGEFDSVGAFVENWLEEDLPNYLWGYFDFSKFGNSLISNGEYYTVNSEESTIFVFSSNY